MLYGKRSVEAWILNCYKKNLKVDPQLPSKGYYCIKVQSLVDFTVKSCYLYNIIYHIRPIKCTCPN